MGHRLLVRKGECRKWSVIMRRLPLGFTKRSAGSIDARRGPDGRLPSASHIARCS